MQVAETGNYQYRGKQLIMVETMAAIDWWLKQVTIYTGLVQLELKVMTTIESLAVHGGTSKSL